MWYIYMYLYMFDSGNFYSVYILFKTIDAGLSIVI